MNKQKLFGIILTAISTVGASITGYALDNKTENNYVLKHNKNMQYNKIYIKDAIKDKSFD